MWLWLSAMSRKVVFVFKKLDPEQLQDWLERYSLSELWEKNVLGGQPVIRLHVTAEGQTDTGFCRESARASSGWLRCFRCMTSAS